MWCHEVERIGMQRCTPVGYALQRVGELVRFLGLLVLLGVPVYLAYRAVVGTFNWSLLWLLTLPFVLGIVGSVIVAVSWSLAYRKNFQYDDERCDSSWTEGGEMRKYTFTDWKATEARPNG